MISTKYWRNSMNEGNERQVNLKTGEYFTLICDKSDATMFADVYEKPNETCHQAIEITKFFFKLNLAILTLLALNIQG